MKKLIWKLITKIDNNWGYTTPTQRRYYPGDKCKIGRFKLDDTCYGVGTEVTIIENGRHDYLVTDSDGVKEIVYQFELFNNCE